MKRVERAGKGVLLYMKQEDGDRLEAKIKAYALQERAATPSKPTRNSGFRPICAITESAPQILVRSGGQENAAHGTNNPRKVVGFGGVRLEIVRTYPDRDAADRNQHPLSSRRKGTNSGHMLGEIVEDAEARDQKEGKSSPMPIQHEGKLDARGKKVAIGCQPIQ